VKKFDINDLNYQLSWVDIHCAWFDKISKNKISFDNDLANGKALFLNLTCYKNYCCFTEGSHLRPIEKQLQFTYKVQDNINQLTNGIAKFVNSYFDSIKTEHVRE
jgi:hypothetical protein